MLVDLKGFVMPPSHTLVFQPDRWVECSKNRSINASTPRSEYHCKKPNMCAHRRKMGRAPYGAYTAARVLLFYMYINYECPRVRTLPKPTKPSELASSSLASDFFEFDDSAPPHASPWRASATVPGPLQSWLDRFDARVDAAVGRGRSIGPWPLAPASNEREFQHVR